MGYDIELLVFLASKGAAFQAAHITTVEVGKAVRCSQQTASRKLLELEKAGLVTRDPSLNGLEVRLTEDALGILKDVHSSLSEVFLPKPLIKGHVVDGIGEAAWYVKRYASKISHLLGYVPFFGTLNVAVDPRNIKAVFASVRPFRIEEFRSGDRTFGGVSIYIGIIAGDEAAILAPDRSRYGPEIIEIIARRNLRKKLGLKKGSKVEFFVHSN